MAPFGKTPRQHSGMGGRNFDSNILEFRAPSILSTISSRATDSTCTHSRIGFSSKISEVRAPSRVSTSRIHASGIGDTHSRIGCSSNISGVHHVSTGRRNESGIRESATASHAVFRRYTKLASRPTEVNRHEDEFTEAFLDEVDQEVAEHDSFGTRLRSRLAHIILTQRFEMCIGILIITNFVVIALETDARARRDSAANSSDREFADSLLVVITVAHIMYSCAYTLECGVRLYVLRWDFFNHAWNNFDLIIVAMGVVAEIINIVTMHSSNIEGLDGLRTIRTIRMVKVTRVVISFEELYALVSGVMCSMKALMWAFILMLMVLTMWSIIAVEYVKPLMPGIAAKDGFGSCSWCPSAFDNVLLSNLTWFQIISGDGWSHVGRPLIEAHGWTVILFVAVIFSMVFGLLNLIVAVIVDSAAQARQADIMDVAARKDAARAAAWDCFDEMVGALDSNGDGHISIDELKTSLLDNEESSHLAAYLTTMGVELSDLDMVFDMLDSDGDGSVTHEEFTNQLYQMKTAELPITLCYVRSSVSKLHSELEKVSAAIQTKLDEMLSSEVDGAGRNPQLVAPSTVLPAAAVSETGSPRKSLLPMAAQRSAGRVSLFSPSNTDSTQKRVSLFKGKPPPTLRGFDNPRQSCNPRQSFMMGGLPATQVGNSSTSSEGHLEKTKLAPEPPQSDVKDISFQFSGLPGFSLDEKEEENCSEEESNCSE